MRGLPAHALDHEPLRAASKISHVLLRWPCPTPRPSSSRFNLPICPVPRSRSFAFLCSCSKSGGGSRGGQAVKLAGRNHDMKRRCGIATSWRPAPGVLRNCIDLSPVARDRDPGPWWHGFPRPPDSPSGTDARGPRGHATAPSGRQLQDGNAQALGVSAWPSLMYAQKTLCRCTFLTLNSVHRLLMLRGSIDH